MGGLLRDSPRLLIVVRNSPRVRSGHRSRILVHSYADRRGRNRGRDCSYVGLLLGRIATIGVGMGRVPGSRLGLHGVSQSPG